MNAFERLSYALYRVEHDISLARGHTQTLKIEMKLSFWQITESIEALLLQSQFADFFDRIKYETPMCEPKTILILQWFLPSLILCLQAYCIDKLNEETEVASTY